ncbi:MULTISPECIES: hypothetical protein [unclassified Bradyrhizobium]
MKFKLIRVAGEVRAASVTLTEAERIEILAGRVPFGYAGGLGIDRQEVVEGGIISFSGACFVDREANLIKALGEFRDALTASIKEQARIRAELKRDIQREEDERAGYEAFPGGRFADAMRGTKSFPNHPRCPFKQPARVAAWEAGYNRAHDGLIEAFSEAA